MDKARAHTWFAELLGHDIHGWTPLELIGHGKSAIVVKAEKAGQFGALKIFEPELVERFGSEKQLQRIQRETSLIGKSIAHLVEILGGGEAASHMYVVMEYLPSPWRPLSEHIATFPRERIWPTISAIAEATRGLEDAGLVHRDIKPENVMVTDDLLSLKVMDLGVMRFIGAGSITDDISRPFIGTLRYSSPEFLLREEENTLEGWKAVSFYQLGGVLHDLIMRRPLFADFSEPYARLAIAVREQTPTIDAPDVHVDLLHLARNCLVKDPQIRLQCVTWDRFVVPHGMPESPAEAARERVKRRRLLGSQMRSGDGSPEQVARQMAQAKELVVQGLKSAIRDTMVVDEFPARQLPDLPQATSRNDFAAFALKFGPSTEHGLHCQVRVEFFITVVDPTERVCKIEFQEREPVRTDPVDSQLPQVLYVGVFEQEVVRLAVRDYLYLLIDRIQETTAGAADNE
jgi:eukaryotic-like serine/threonine-protein kinase